MSDNDGSGVLLAFLAGLAVGGGVALLLAPQSGQKTREMLKKSLDDAEAEALELAQKARGKAEQGMEYGRELAGKARVQYDQARARVQHHGKEVVDMSLEELEKRKDHISQAIEAGRKAMEDAKKEV